MQAGGAAKETWHKEYPTMAALTEDSVYGFARFYIMRAVGREIGFKVMTPEQLVIELERKDKRGTD
jgi:hypothetical protein